MVLALAVAVPLFFIVSFFAEELPKEASS